MGLRFQRRLTIVPGVRLNFSKSGVSTSLGVRGAHLTIGKTPRVTVGLPGSGLSWTETLNKDGSNRRAFSIMLWVVISLSILAVLAH